MKEDFLKEPFPLMNEEEMIDQIALSCKPLMGYAVYDVHRPHRATEHLKRGQSK